ncbi:cell division protein FtsQ/DivIB [Geobacter sp. DSM 9736]|uniref:cell division protein FtsQ/DivIB n=1 Tax=Geobacter sp. DSM 9736 TaxID=1277350 RepID=UPI000B5085EA|nr:FtsQ-type POTRA domain-containing protein [Geobacter sp. DSM 9736]SNB47821.1 cell division protein FtsQ [Geobacter sp. DSM 9736]
MRDLRQKNQKPVSRNRVKRERIPIDYRGILKKGVRFIRWATVVSLAVLVVYEVYGVVARTTFLRLERIEVSGLKRLTREEVVTQAGVKVGDGMLGLRLRRIGEQLSKIPWVDKVRVRRYFPGSLIVEIAEREPQAIAHMGYLYYLDKGGEPFKPLTVGDSLDYPVITGVTEEDMARDPAGSREALKGALDLIAILNEGAALKMDEVSEIHFDKGFGYTLFALQNGVPVKLGNGQYREKLQRLARIYRELQAQLPNVEYVDLDYGDRIIVKKS